MIPERQRDNHGKMAAREKTTKKFERKEFGKILKTCNRKHRLKILFIIYRKADAAT
jgi:hypothetical protein